MKKEPPDQALPSSEQDPDELQPEYDSELLRQGVRGKYAARYAEGTNVVLLDPDVARAFPDAAAVNAALRALLEIARREAVGGGAPPRTPIAPLAELLGEMGDDRADR